MLLSPTKFTGCASILISVSALASPSPQVASHLGSAPPFDGNLLLNGGFEAPNGSANAGSSCPAIVGSLPANWSDNSCWSGNTTAQIAYGAPPLNPHAGAQSVRIDIGSGVMQLIQPVDLEAGRLYEASVWMRASAPVEVSLSLRQADAPYVDYVVRTIVPTMQWQRYEVSGYAQTTSALFMLRCTVPVGGTTPISIFVDDASLIAKRRITAALPLAASIIPGTYFGMHFHSPAIPWPSALPQLDTVRIWDADGVTQGSPCAQWTCVNPAPGVYQWQAIDAHVARAQANGAEIVFNLGRTPQWASARPNEPTPYGPGQAAEPASDLAWQNWVTAVGQRYQGKIRYYEIWNEPNDSQFYTGSVTKLVSLAAQAHTILKAIDPANQIITPCPYDIAYLNEYLGAGGGAYADIVGFHFYVASEIAPEYLYESFVPNVRLVMQQHGVGSLPLWNTESGWFSGPPYPTNQEVGYLARSILLAWAGGVQRFLFYSWDEQPNAGVLLAAPPNYATLTASGKAFGELGAWLVSSKMTQLTRQGDVWILELERTSGVRAHVVWNPVSNSQFLVPASYGATALKQLDGTSAPLASGAVLSIGEMPILIE